MLLSANDCTLHVALSGPPGAPCLLLHALGTDLHVWDAQAETLAHSFRVLQLDLRGHGLSSVTPGPRTIDALACDALAVLDALGVERAHVGGVSVGGMVAQALAACAPARWITPAFRDAPEAQGLHAMLRRKVTPRRRKPLPLLT